MPNTTCSPGRDASVNDIVASLGLDPVDIAEADEGPHLRHTTVTRSTTSPCATSTKQQHCRSADKNSPWAEHAQGYSLPMVITTSVKEASLSLSATGGDCYSTNGSELDGSSHIDTSTPSSTTEWGFPFDLDPGEYYDPIDFPTDCSIGDNGQSIWTYPWLQQELR